MNFYYIRQSYTLQIVSDATITNISISGSGNTYEYGEVVHASAELVDPSEDKLPRWTPTLNNTATSYLTMMDARYSTEEIQFAMPAGNVSISVTKGDFTGIIQPDGHRITWYELVNHYGMNVNYGYTEDEKASTVIDRNHLNGYLILDPMQYTISTQYAGCTSITGLSVPASLKIMATGAFSGCSNLEEVDLQCGLSNYGNTFANCTKLNHINLGGTTSYHIMGGTFSGCDSLKSIVIPMNIISLQPKAFENCTGLEEITFLNDNCYIYYRAFAGCTSLESITLPKNLTSVYTEAFADCTSLKTVVLPESTLTEIGQGAFKGCTALEEFIIPDTVTKIGGAAFRDCTKLKKVYMSSNNYRMESQYSGEINSWFYHCDEQIHLYIGGEKPSVLIYVLYFSNDQMGYDPTNCDSINYGERYFSTHVTYNASLDDYINAN